MDRFGVKPMQATVANRRCQEDRGAGCALLALQMLFTRRRKYLERDRGVIRCRVGSFVV